MYDIKDTVVASGIASLAFIIGLTALAMRKSRLLCMVLSIASIFLIVMAIVVLFLVQKRRQGRVNVPCNNKVNKTPSTEVYGKRQHKYKRYSNREHTKPRYRAVSGTSSSGRKRTNRYHQKKAHPRRAKGMFDMSKNTTVTFKADDAPIAISQRTTPPSRTMSSVHNLTSTQNPESDIEPDMLTGDDIEPPVLSDPSNYYQQSAVQSDQMAQSLELRAMHTRLRFNEKNEYLSRGASRAQTTPPPNDRSIIRISKDEHESLSQRHNRYGDTNAFT